jgi:hypothetical protein
MSTGGAAQAAPSFNQGDAKMLREILDLLAFKVVVLVALFAVLSLPDTW